MNTIIEAVGRFVKWLFGAPFRVLPSEFGNEAPAELRVYEAKTEEVQHETREERSPEPAAQAERTKPPR
jgi:hypothetical protein